MVWWLSYYNHTSTYGMSTTGGGHIDVDEVFEKIGGFGRAQKKIYYLMNSAQIAAGFHTLILTFIAIVPEWSCGNKQGQGVCTQFDLGDCKPKYDPSVSSIIAEVRTLIVYS